MPAEKFRAFIPRAIDCISVAPPRSTGQLSHLYVSLHFGSRSDVVTIEPSDFRHAIAYADGVRIITPSITAWPPTIRSRSIANTVWTNRSVLLEVLFMFLAFTRIV